MTPTQHPIYRRQLQLFAEAFALSSRFHDLTDRFVYDHPGQIGQPVFYDRNRDRALRIRKALRARYMRRSACLDAAYAKAEADIKRTAEEAAAVEREAFLDPSQPDSTSPIFQTSLPPGDSARPSASASGDADDTSTGQGGTLFICAFCASPVDYGNDDDGFTVCPACWDSSEVAS